MSCSHHSRYLLFFGSLVLLAAGAAISVAGSRKNQPEAIYRNGILSVTIPYHAATEGKGRLVAEIVSPEDKVLGQVQASASIAQGDGAWQQEIRLEKPLPLEDVVWQRLRYRFEYAGNARPAIAGVEPIANILRRPVVHILGQTQYLAGSHAAIRVVVCDAGNDDAPAPGTVTIELLDQHQAPRQLYRGKANQRGTVDAQFRFPDGLTGSYQLHYIADTPIGFAEYTQPVELKSASSILLTTEKPIYQPGQTIHVRALALDRLDSRADADRPLTFELEDSRGNKVFRKATATDRFGVASAEFALADEVNLGDYHLRALMGDAATPDTAELTLNVARYVLPKFKVDVEFTSKNGKPKRDYRPGDHVTGTVRANYFFGKPVDHAEITVKASGSDVTVFEAASASGQTDRDGNYKFDLTLPAYFAGKAMNQGAAPALIEATVKDSAAHSETRGEAITISQSPLLVTAVPEGGALIPHLENEIFVLTSYPDGTPAKSSLIVHLPQGRDEKVTTDSAGIGVVRFNPASDSAELNVDADDRQGNRVSSKIPLEMREGADQILLRTTAAVLKAGDRMQLTVLSTRTNGAAYIDIVKNGQTIMTRDVDLANGQAAISVDATPEMTGTLDINAYMFSRDAEPIADHRLVFVQPADELKIAATSDAPVYKPGADARIHFHVSNAHGEGVNAALGLQVVDEAVFALAEKQPGFAKVFFYLNQEVMKPRYEIHSVSLPDVVAPESGIRRDDGEARNLAARALFSATEMNHPTRLNTEFGRNLPQDKYEAYRQRYQTVFEKQAHHLVAGINNTLTNREQAGAPATALEKILSAKAASSYDSWGTPFRLEPAQWSWRDNHYYLLQSAGPDRSFGTADDFTAYLKTNTRVSVNEPEVVAGPQGSFRLQIEQSGPFTGRATISGSVKDVTGANIPDTSIVLERRGAHETRITHSDAQGQFEFAGLPPGSYEAKLSATGFVDLSGLVILKARDRAVISAQLAVGSVSQTVAVVPEPEFLMPRPSPPGIFFRRGGLRGAVAGAMAPTPMPAMEMALAKRSFAVDKAAQTETPAADAASPTPHVRSYFPEALYVNPEIVTDGNGNADISIPMADSITTWKLSMLASTRSGALGTAVSSLKVFQDFFVDLDLPVTLTEGDQVSIPVAAYNYAAAPGKVRLTLEPEEWFTLENDQPEKSVAVDAGRVGAAQFTLRANRIGKFKLVLKAQMDGAEKRNDIVVREIEVMPNGKEQNQVFNGTLEHDAEHALRFPANAIPDATTLFVRLYPGPLSQVIEGMDSILSMPGGCFEQTSSSTYPNVLALDYMKRTKKLTPEVHARAEGYIANGYQRLLTFEVPGGGFSWFGQAPANKILTAYGLMEFHDMSKVSDVDPKVIQRTQEWLAGQQKPDGSWQPDTSFINEGATNRYNTNVLRITAYLGWALADTGYQGAAVERAKEYVESHQHGNVDSYTLAVIANFANAYGKDRDFTRRAMQALIDARTEKGDQIFWTAEETSVYATGESATIETTGLATQALLQWGQASGIARKALTYISAKKDSSGNWGTTQATIMALRALLLASEKNGADVRGSVVVSINGKEAETLKLTSENNDLFHQFAFKNINASAANTVSLRLEGSGELAYQVVARYYTPWEEKPAQEALSIDLDYDRSKMAENDIVTEKVTVRNHLDKTANMVMIDLGIPPGFDPLTEDLQSLQEKATANPGSLQKFSLTATQAILYFNALGPKQNVTFTLRLRAKYPIKARTFQSRVYEYYNPAVNAVAQPVALEVTR